MKQTDISNLRLINQQVITSKFKTAKEIVDWMGAMQAQDLNMAKWAIGVRLPNSTDKLIASAIDNGHIFRTHLLRPTWHFVSSDDICWMLELTAPQIKASMKSRDKELEITDIIYKKSNSTIEEALQGSNHLSREALVAELEQVNIATDNNRASHLLMRAELNGLICSGKIKNNKQTYALLRERVPITNSLTRDEALARLAQKYFTSHCPATLQDFVWWSGLGVTESRHALEMVKSNLVSEIIDQQTYWFTHSFAIPKLENDLVYLLPAFDEVIISYKDRTASLSFELNKKAVSNNGIFRPTILINGQVRGIWKRTIKKDKIILETEFFQQVSKETMNLVEIAANQYGDFMNKKVEMV